MENLKKPAGGRRQKRRRMEEPAYFHLWDCCRFLATFKELHHWQDIYICGEGEDAVIVTVRNNDPADTFDLMQSTLELPDADKYYPAAAWGYRLAKSKGLL